MPSDTRERILTATNDLYRRQGMAGTGLKQIAEEAGAPFGSIYHFFPGGKAALTEDVIRTWGVLYHDQVLAVLQQFEDVPQAIDLGFVIAAERLAESDYTEGCPVATVALEVASSDETLRVATADVFTDWIAGLVAFFESTRLPPDVRRRLALGFLTSLQGAFVLCRSLRSPEPLHAAGRTVLDALRQALAEHAPA